MAFDAHANLAASLVVTEPAPPTSGTSLTVTAGQGALFPAPPFNCTVCPANTMPTQANAEIVRVTALVGDTFTIERAQEGTTAKPIAAGYYFANSITAKVITDIEAETGAGVTTLTGTAGEVDVSAPSGAVTVSLPAALVFTGKTIAGGTFNGPTLTAAALGTPVSGVATNLTGTALGLTAGTAGTVVTNANLTGDVTSVGNATTLATVNGAPGVFGSASLIPVVTVNAKGLVTSVTTAAVGAADAGSLTGTTLASNVVNASLNAITPTGGTLAVTGAVNATGNIDITNASVRQFSITRGSMITAWQAGVAEAYLGTTSNHPLNLMANNATVAAVSSTGVAITGGVGATGNINAQNISVPNTNWFYWGAGSSRIVGDSVGGSVTVMTGATARGQFASAGFAVTGAVTATGAISGFKSNSSYTGGNGNNITNTDDTSGSFFLLFNKAAGTSIGSVSRVGSTDAVVYSTSSDGRLKKNVREYDGSNSGPIIDALKPRWFDWTEGDKDESRNIIGFIAQEVNAVSPDMARIGAVTPGDTKDGPVTKETKTWMRCDVALIPIIVAELKSMRARVAALESAVVP